MFSRPISIIPSFARPIKPVLPCSVSTTFIIPSIPSIPSSRPYSNDHSHDHSHDHGYGHGHGHGHGHTPRVSAGYEANSKEYLEKYYAQELATTEKNWLPIAFNNKNLLEIVAEISATEAYVAKVDTKTLIAKYKEQLGNFENVRRPLLQKDGIDKKIIDNLHECYKFRAHISEHELKENIDRLGFLPQGYRVAVDTGYVSKRRLVGPFQRKPLVQPSALKSSGSRFTKRVAGVVLTNDAQSAQNVKHFRGIRGLVNAVDKGLTDQQKDQLLNILREETISAEDVAEIESAVVQLRESYRQGNGNRALASILKQLKSDLHRQKFVQLILAESAELKHELEEAQKSGDLVTVVPYQQSPAVQAKTKLGNAFSSALARAKDPKAIENIKKLSAAVEHFSSPALQKDLELLSLFRKTEISPENTEKILSLFQDNSDSDALLNDVINPHPIAAKMWFPRITYLARDSVYYTQKFAEGNESLYPDITGDNKKIDEILASKNYLSPELPPTYNTALEEIYEMKLERLAKQFYGYDLSTELGLAQFDFLVHKYDVSPGESYLDRCHTYPPPHHTYDELPIIKYDGYDPLSEEGIKAVAAHSGHH